MINTEFMRNNILTFGLELVSEKAILELLDHLKATEKERDWHAERCEDAMNECAALRAEIEAAKKTRDGIEQQLVRSEVDKQSISEAHKVVTCRLSSLADENTALRAALLSRLEAAEKSDAESLAMYRKARDERDELRAALQHETDCVEAAKAEIDALRSKIEAMEQQEPIGTTGGMPGTTGFTMACFHANKVPVGSKLYALPGAKGE